MLCTLSSLNSAKSIILMSCLVVRDVVAEVVFHILLSNFLSKSSSQMMLILPYVLLDVEDTLGVELLAEFSVSILLLSGLVAHSVVFHIVVANLLLNNSAVMMLIFLMLEWISRTLSALSVSMSILLLSGLVAELVVLHILVANFVVKTSSPRDSLLL